MLQLMMMLMTVMKTGVVMMMLRQLYYINQKFDNDDKNDDYVYEVKLGTFCNTCHRLFLDKMNFKLKKYKNKMSNVRLTHFQISVLCPV